MTTPDPARWAAIKALFEATVDLPAAQREPVIGSAGLGPEALAELRSLLAHHDAATSEQVFMAESAAQGLADAPGVAARTGERLGAWQVVRPIGSGGMGDVFEVRRADGQFDGRAALKLLKRGMDSTAVLRRFALERQALARLNHPHIARLFDAGQSAAGLPYFVMEFVDGVPIDEASAALPLTGRLALFLQLAAAVSHAHHNLLVHRDLKPGNVLVDADGQVKLLDFGIAKALDPLESPEGLNGNTTVGTARPFTPNYASPEQVRGEPVSTATDIYSLGVLLYLLLTGLRPTGRDASTPAEAARSVLEEQPTRPSSLGPELVDDPRWLANRKHLQGDLDNILLKALEKPIERRYASVDAMAADVRAYLSGHPVSARAPRPGYVFAKFVSRHRAAVAGASFALVALLAGLAGTAWQAQRAQSRLKDVRGIAGDVVIRYGDAITRLPGGMKIKEELLTDTLVYLDRLSGEADDDLEFKGEIAMAYSRLADLQVSNNVAALDKDATGDRSATRAIALFEAAEPGAPTDPTFYAWWARALRSRALVARGANRLDDAVGGLERAAQVLERGLKRFPDNADVRAELGSILFLTGQVNHSLPSLPNRNRSDAALELFERSQKIYGALAAAEAKPVKAAIYESQLGTIEGARALVYLSRQQFKPAIAHSRAAVAHKQKGAEFDPSNAHLRGTLSIEAGNLAAACLDDDDVPGALRATELAAEVLAGLRRDEPDNAYWRTSERNISLHRGRALLARGDAAGALGPLQISETWLLGLQADGKATPAQRRRLAWTQLTQSAALQRLGRPAESAQRAESARALLAALTEQAPADAASWLLLGELGAGRPAWADAGRDAYARAAALGPIAGRHLVLATRLGAASAPR